MKWGTFRCPRINERGIKKQSEKNIFIDRGIDRKIKNDSTRALGLLRSTVTDPVYGRLRPRMFEPGRNKKNN
jgi:hypothetical protein